MLKSIGSSLLLATVMLGGWGSTSAQAQVQCGATTNVTSATSTTCLVPTQTQTLSCQAISGSVSHQINITEMSAVEVSVQASGGNPTLIINGPDGCFSALANNGKATIPGFWSPGLYNIYVGGVSGNATLSIVHTH